MPNDKVNGASNEKAENKYGDRIRDRVFNYKRISIYSGKAPESNRGV